MLRLLSAWGIYAFASVVEVEVDDRAEIQGTRSIPSSFTEKELLKESVKCPVSDLVALGTSCSCEGTDCGEGKYCFGEKPTCQDKPRQDPSLLDWHGKTAKGPHDGKDKGQIAGREFKFYKKSEKSGLRLFYSDNLRVYCHSQPSGASSWEIMIDGQPCPSGGIYGAYHVHRSENPHRINGWGGYCKGVGKGEHTVSVHVRPTPGYEAAYRHDAFTGWQGWGSGDASWHLEAQEVPEDYPFYHYVEGRLADGRDGGVVNGRVLNFNKQLADSRLRLFYSDNLRIHGRPHKSGACRWHLRIDGQMCGSGAITGDVYGHAPDNVHRQRSFMGYCDNVPAGQHKVDVHIEAIHHHWVCDAYTGWNSNFLLEAEEIPKEYQMVKVHMSHNADGRDSGAMGAYRISFTKNHADTRLRLFYSDNLRALSGAHDCACKWEILVDGNQCPSVEIFGQVYVRRHHGGNVHDTNPHRPRSFAGFCDGVTKGDHVAIVNVKQQGPACDCYTLWHPSANRKGSHGALEVHEFFKPCSSLTKSECKEPRCVVNSEEDRCSDLIPCPGNDKVAVGSACQCGKEAAAKGKFCYEDKTVHDGPKEEKSDALGLQSPWLLLALLALSWLDAWPESGFI